MPNRPMRPPMRPMPTAATTPPRTAVPTIRQNPMTAPQRRRGPGLMDTDPQPRPLPKY